MWDNKVVGFEVIKNDYPPEQYTDSQMGFSMLYAWSSGDAWGIASAHIGGLSRGGGGGGLTHIKNLRKFST